MSEQWYYNQDGAQYGPVEEADIIKLIKSGEISPGVLVCQRGMKNWEPARKQPCFQVEVYPRRKSPKKTVSEVFDLPIDPDFEAELLKAAENAINTGASVQNPSPARAPKSSVKPAGTPSNPTTTAQAVKSESVLPWIVAGAASIALIGVEPWITQFIRFG
jgi:hypothetical protein